MDKHIFEEFERLFGKLNEVQQGAVLALAEGIFLHQLWQCWLQTGDALLILEKIGGQTTPEEMLTKLIDGGWVVRVGLNSCGPGVTLPENVRDYLILRRARHFMV